MTAREATYRVTAKRHLVETELKKTQMQLAAYQKRMDDIKFSVKTYIAFLTVPWIVAIIFSFLSKGTSNIISVVVTVIPMVLSAGIGLFLFPFSVHSLIKYLMIYGANREDDSILFAPPSERNPIEVLNRPSEQSLRAALRMVEWETNRYAFFLTQLDEWAAELKNDPTDARIDEIADCANKLPLYIDIKAVDTLNKRQSILNGLITAAIFVFIALIVFVTIIQPYLHGTYQLANGNMTFLYCRYRPGSR